VFIFDLEIVLVVVKVALFTNQVKKQKICNANCFSRFCKSVVMNRSYQCYSRFLWHFFRMCS